MLLVFNIFIPMKYRLIAFVFTFFGTFYFAQKVQNQNTPSPIEKVTFNKENYSLVFSTAQKKNHEKELFEIAGYTTGTVAINKAKNITVNFYSNQGAYITSELVFYEKKNILFLANLKGIFPLNNKNGNRICELKKLNMDIEKIESDMFLFDLLDKPQNCRKER